MNHTQNVFITWQKKHEFWRELLIFQNQGIHSILWIRKRSYRDAKMKKLEKFWRENAVGIGLCNECVLWWGVRFERHARTRFISSKSTLVNFQQGWKNKPQVAMKLPDFCLTPLKSICFQSCCIHRQIHPLGCWDPRA